MKTKEIINQYKEYKYFIDNYNEINIIYDINNQNEIRILGLLFVYNNNGKM